MQVAWLSLGTLCLLSAALTGCMTPAEVTSALEAPLPEADVPFLVLATACGDAPVQLLSVYPDGRLYHADLDHAGQAARLPPEGEAPSSEAERVVLDAVAAGALESGAFADAQGGFRISHLERATLSASDVSDLRRRVTLAGFPALAPSYGEPSCGDRYAAWADGHHVSVHAAPGAGPWALRHVGAGVRELHG